MKSKDFELCEIASCKRHAVRRQDCISVFSNIENVAEALFLKSNMLFLNCIIYQKRGSSGDLGWCGGDFNSPSASLGPNSLPFISYSLGHRKCSECLKYDVVQKELEKEIINIEYRQNQGEKFLSAFQEDAQAQTCLICFHFCPFTVSFSELFGKLPYLHIAL